MSKSFFYVVFSFFIFSPLLSEAKQKSKVFKVNYSELDSQNREKEIIERLTASQTLEDLESVGKDFDMKVIQEQNILELKNIKAGDSLILIESQTKDGLTTFRYLEKAVKTTQLGAAIGAIIGVSIFGSAGTIFSFATTLFQVMSSTSIDIKNFLFIASIATGSIVIGAMGGAAAGFLVSKILTCESKMLWKAVKSDTDSFREKYEGFLVKS